MNKAAFPNARILIVDDEQANVLLLETILRLEGYTNFRSTTNPRKVFPLFTEAEPDLILLDLMMPGMTGYEVMDALEALTPAGTFLPILVLTANASPEAKRKALSGRATDFLTKPFDHSEVVLRIRNLLATRRFHLQLRSQNDLLEEMVRGRTRELHKALETLRTTQQQVIQQERLQSLGIMASGVVHDFNNAISVILGHGELVLQDCHRGAPIAGITDSVRSIVTAALDSAEMISRLREFHRPADGTEIRQPVDLNALARQAVTLTAPRWKSQAAERGAVISIETELSAVPAIQGHAPELREILTNLIFNAVDAMPTGGTIRLRTRAELGDVVLEVSDTGAGMTEQVRQRCLEPFFTTKGEKGTGLGLSIVYGIVQRHRGTVDIKSQLGQGATFTFRFPADLVASAQTQPHAAGSAERTWHILVVDDEPVLRDTVARYLEHDLHAVEKAADGPEALEKFRAGNFDLVITDQAMAGMNGDELAAAIHALRPEIPVILLTGFTELAGSGGAGRPQINLVLGKPVSRLDLRDAVGKVMTR